MTQYPSQPYPTQYFALQSAPQYQAQNNQQYYSQGYGSQPLQQSSQQSFQSLSQPQWQPLPQMQQSIPQSTRAIVDPQYCAPFPATFYVKDKLLSWSGGDVTILDERGNLVFTVDSKVLSIRGSRVLKDAAGNPVCAMKEKIISLNHKWVVCKGAQVDDSSVVGSINKEIFSLHHGVQAKLAGSDAVEYSLRSKGYIVGSREIDILHQGQIIGHVTRMRSGEAIFLDKQSYRVTLNPGYDHAFILCVVIIMDEYYHEQRS